MGAPAAGASTERVSEGGALDAAFAFLRARYLVADRRVLGLFRIYFGGVLVVDMLRRLPDAALFYSSGGVLSNHSPPPYKPYFSVFQWLSTTGSVRAMLAFAAAACALYLVGYMTRAMQIAVFVLVTSVNARNYFIENGGTIVVNVVAFWSMFLPLGDRFSVDALLASRRDSGPAPGALDDPTRAPFSSIAMLAVAVQIAGIYLFNAIHKSGPTWWRGGDAVHYVLWQSRMATGVAGWLRLHEPAWFSPLASWSALAIEWAAPFLVLSPFARRYVRTAHVLLACSLHLSIAVLMNLGPFPYALIALNLLILPGEALDWAARRLAPACASPRGLWLLGRLRAARDRFVRLAAPEPTGTGPAAPTKRAVRAAKVWGGLAAPQIAREAFVGVMLFATIVQLSRDNHLVPKRYRLRQYEPLRSLMLYPRLLQGWGFFAPDAPKQDGTVVVDAVTADGRHIDPFTGKPPDFEAALHGPGGLGQLYSDYFQRINLDGLKRYRADLKHYLLTRHKLEGLPPGDRITSFEAWWVTNDSPPPGSVTPTNIQKSLLVASR